MRSAQILLLLVVGLLVLPSASTAAVVNATVTLSPIGLGIATSWDLDWQFNNGDASVGDNTVTLSNFSFTGWTLGALTKASNATGTLASGLTFTDASLGV